MTKYIQGKDGKFEGSIGSGKTNIPPHESNTAGVHLLTDEAKKEQTSQQFLDNAEIALHRKYLKQYGEEADWAYSFSKNTYPAFSKNKAECLTLHTATGTKMGYTSPSALEPNFVDYDEAEIDHYMQLEPHPTLEGVYVSKSRYLEASYEGMPEDTVFAVRLNDSDYDRLLVHGNEIVGEWHDYDTEAYVTESDIYEDELGGSIESVDNSSTRIVRTPNGTPIAINTYLSAERKPSEPDWDDYYRD